MLTTNSKETGKYIMTHLIIKRITLSHYSI
jgi:hypothetical protein